MDCRETQALLTAFHDGELPAADRVRVEEHLRGCRECGALLADLARADRAAGVPDPGPAYWDRFNARVMDRVEREADGPKVTILRPKGGWMRQQLRYLVPAAAVAALVVVVVRYGGMNPGAPAVPPAASEPAAPLPAGERTAKAEPESRAGKKAEPAAVARRVPEESNRVAKAPAAPPPATADERFAAVVREERDRLADRPLPEAKDRTSRDRAAAPAAMSAPSPPPPMTFRSAPAGPSPVTAAGGMPSKMQAERKEMAGAASLMAERQVAAKAEPASSPCELARTLAARKRFREAEAAQRACLAQDRSAPAQEKGLVFLAELLDRQERFADADAVITEVDRQFPQSRPLDLYRQQRPMVQKRPMAVPGSR
ncbi:MAG: zf-HC2 domain-containing protein [bacterium]|nr:zf-HC2 domain-containing protein [bacterium]